MKEPNIQTEFEVQAYLWNGLRQLGFNVRGEVATVYDVGPNCKRRQKCRFDLAHFVDGELAGIIEVKQKAITHKTAAGWKGTRQGQRYHDFGVPVRIVYGMPDADALINSASATGKLFA